MRVLVAASSRHGATEEIAAAIADGLVERGMDADALAIEDVASLEGYGAVVLGSAVYMGKWLKAARKFVDANATQLAERPVWLFGSGPLGPPDHLVPEGEPADIPRVIELTRARGHRVFAGRLERSRLGVAERVAAGAVHAPDADSRDWKAIDEYAAQIAAELSELARAAAENAPS